MRKQDTPGETNQHEKLHRTTRLSTRQEMTKVHTKQVEHKTGIMTIYIYIHTHIIYPV